MTPRTLASTACTTLLAIALHSSMTALPLAAVESNAVPVVGSAGLSADLRVPWSQPVQVNDPFEGNFLAVFDRNDIRQRRLRDGSPSRFISLWSRDSIRVLVLSDQGCDRVFLGSHLSAGCDRIQVPRSVQTLFVKVGDRILEIQGENSRFTVNQEIANILKNAPVENIQIRLVLEGGETVDSEIGQGTVQAWQTIY